LSFDVYAYGVDILITADACKALVAWKPVRLVRLKVEIYLNALEKAAEARVLKTATVIQKLLGRHTWDRIIWEYILSSC
jgi:hypothetical protein